MYLVLCRARLQVPRPTAAAPQFSQKLESLTVDEGATATLECHVTGHPEPGVRWYKEGRPLTASQKVEMRKQDGRVRLILYGLKEHDSGRYTCIAQNHLGENSTSANIIVNGLFSFFFLLTQHINYTQQNLICCRLMLYCFHTRSSAVTEKSRDAALFRNVDTSLV